MERYLMTDFQPKTMKPSCGVPVRFKGRMLAQTEWETSKGCWMRFTVWETPARAYIAVIEGDTPGKPDQVHRQVNVIKPIMDQAGERDEIAMQIGVLDAFDWHDRAKAVLKSELGWAPFIEID